jgi:hypothetical protein
MKTIIAAIAFIIAASTAMADCNMLYERLGLLSMPLVGSALSVTTDMDVAFELIGMAYVDPDRAAWLTPSDRMYIAGTQRDFFVIIADILKAGCEDT